MDGTVHWLKEIRVPIAAVFIVLVHGRIHDVGVVLQVARSPEQLSPSNVSGPDFLVAACLLEFANQPLHLLPDDRPVRQQQGNACANQFREREQLEIAAQAAMIAALRLLDPGEMGIQLFTSGEQCAVDPLQLRPFLVAAPVCAGHVGQSERADLFGRLDVSAAAEVGELGMSANAQLSRVVRKLLNQLLLEWLVAKSLARFINRNLFPDEAVIAAHLLAHPLLNLRQIFRSQRPRQIEVVVEARVDRRSDPDLTLGEHLQDDLSEDVRGRMPHPMQPFRLVNLVRGCNTAGLAVIKRDPGIELVFSHPPAIWARPAAITGGSCRADRIV